jgi:hypothetical protein
VDFRNSAEVRIILELVYTSAEFHRVPSAKCPKISVENHTIREKNTGNFGRNTDTGVHSN